MSNLLEQASLVMIPSGYKEDVVYSEIPLNGAGDLSFTRASNGTRINSQGLVEVCPWNLCTYSEQFQNTDWIGGGNGKPTMTDNFAEAPNGTMTASKIIAASDGYQLRQNNAQENTQMNLSVWLRTNTGTKTIQLFLNNGNTASQNITVTTTWTRYEISGLVTTLSGSGRNGLSTTEALTSSNYILVWGFQLSVGLTAKPYFPTTDRLNVPRLTYQNGGGGCPSLLLEKQSTNYCKWSNDLTQSSAWIDQTSNTTITQITSGGADGGSFTRLVSTGSGSQGRMVQAGSITNPNGATMSVYLKGSGTAGFGLFIGNGISQYIQITLTNTWTRYTVSVSGTGSTYQDWEIDCFGGSTIDVSFVQIEVSSYATSPIYTTSSSATRVADACYKTGISSLIGQTSGSVFFDFTVDTISGQTNDPVLWYMKDGGTGERYVELYSNGNLAYVEYTTLTIASIIKTGLTVGRHKCAIAYATNDFVFYVDGVQIGTDTSGTPSGFSTFAFQYYNSAYYGQQKVNQAVIFPTRLTNAELATLTTL